jgi:hypothetical protein
MIVVGLFDGNIAVYNLQKNTGTGFCNKFATNVTLRNRFLQQICNNVNSGTGFCNKFATNVKIQEPGFATNVNIEEPDFATNSQKMLKIQEPVLQQICNKC